MSLVKRKRNGKGGRPRTRMFSGYTKHESNMLAVLNKMSSGGASDLAMNAMINEFKRGLNQWRRKKQPQSEVQIRTNRLAS